jgi:mannose/fructose/sorbose-specific phosphotransferase system IIA component
VIGLVLAAHGSLPDALLESARMILGKFEQVQGIALMPDDNLERLVDRLRSSVESVDTGDGVLILLDLFGGTPANAATLISQELPGTGAVSGVNVPMLLETLIARQNTSDVRALSDTATNSGKSGVVDIVEAFEKYRQRKATEESHD